MNLSKKITTGLLALSLAFGVAGASAADSAQDNAMVEVACDSETACVLSVGITGIDYGTVQYSMTTARTTSGTIIVTASDDTGSGEGWFVTIHGSDFSTDPLNPFAISNLSLSPSGVTSTQGQSVTGGMNATGTTSGVPNTAATALQILSADEDHGRGHYTSLYDATLTVPAGTLTGDYMSTLTVTITGTNP